MKEFKKTTITRKLYFYQWEIEKILGKFIAFKNVPGGFKATVVGDNGVKTRITGNEIVGSIPMLKKLMDGCDNDKDVAINRWYKYDFLDDIDGKFILNFIFSETYTIKAIEHFGIHHINKDGVLNDKIG